MKEEKNIGKGEMIVYQGGDGGARLEVRLHDGTLWLSQPEMAELFQTTQQNISSHIQNVYDEGELSIKGTNKDFLLVRREGARDVKRTITHYNLDVVISVGYRVKSTIATRFRIWATERLREYIVKGFVMDDERLKNPPGPGVPDYFDEMLERIRDIRASERRVYLRVREIFAMAADYTPSEKDTAKFFSTIQNKLHYAATGLTAAEIIKRRADRSKPNMGLTSFKGEQVRKTDVIVAKNYLSENEIDELNRIVVMWLDFAEDQARRRKLVFLKDWETKLDEFLKFNDRKVLHNAGTVTKNGADAHALREFEEFAAERRKLNEATAETDYLDQLEASVKSLAPEPKAKKN